jgi:hypothetical protein
MNIFLYNRYRKIHKTADGLLYVLYKKDKVNIAKYFKKDGVVKKEHKHLIQQKSKKVRGGASNALVVCSFNVYTWNGYNTKRDTFMKEFKKLIRDKQIDLLLTQEDAHDITYDTSESVKAYSLKEDNNNRFSFIKCIATSLQFCEGIVPRNAIIMKDNRFGITIANLHLEGGRFVDKELNDNTFKLYLEIKLALLREVLGLEQPPDIILGDFNSVFCNDPKLLQKMYDDQKAYYDGSCNSMQTPSSDEDENTEEYLTSVEKQLQKNLGVKLIKKCPNNCSDNGKKTLSLEQVISWNNAPFLLLLQRGYEYIEPSNIRTSDETSDGTGINPTNSRGNNVIDHVWVKSSLRDKYAFSTEIYDGFGEIEDNLYGGLSDHKPVILTIAKPSKRKRYQRYQRS